MFSGEKDQIPPRKFGYSSSQDGISKIDDSQILMRVGMRIYFVWPNIVLYGPVQDLDSGHWQSIFCITRRSNKLQC